MSKARKTTNLGDVLKRSDETVVLQPDASYREVTVKMWGKGVVLRGIVTGAEIASSRRFVTRPGQFILSRIDARNGALGVVPAELDGAVVTNDFPLFSPDPERLDTNYLGWLSRTDGFVELCRRASEGTTNRVRLQEERFLSFSINLPPLAEQRQIVARIEAVAEQLHGAHTLRQQASLETDALYGRAIDVAVTPHGDGWKRTTMADLIETIDAGWSPQCDNNPAVAGDWGVLKTTAVQWCRFLPQYNKALPKTLKPDPTLTLKRGDVLVTRAGPRKRVGVVAAVREDAPKLMISDKIIRLRIDQAKVSPRFLELSLSSSFSQEHLVNRKTGLADAQVNISQAILKKTPVAYPTLPEQCRIVAKLAALQEQVNTLRQLQEEAASELDALLPAILRRAYEGGL